MKAVIYARYSSDNQREESIDAQLRACRDYCTRQAYDIVGTYIDQALTATSDDRPEFQRMVAKSAGAGWDYVVVHKLDRFARNRYDAAIYKKKLRMNGARLASVLENLDDSPESVIMESVLEGMAEYYSRNLSREVKKGLKENAHQMKTTGGFPPLGYDLDADGRYIVNEQEAVLIRMIFTWARDGVSYRRMTEMLNAMGARTKIGREFRPTSIHDILRNEKYKGVLVYNRFQRGVDGKVKRHMLGGNPETIIHDNGIQALVPETDWTAINAAMDERRQPDRTKAGERYLLVSRIFCGLCGAPLSGKGARGLRYYFCTRKKVTGACPNPMVSCEKIDPVVITALRENILNPEAIDGVLPAIRRQAAQRVIDAGIDHEAIRDRLQTLDVEIRRVVDAIAEIGISDALKVKLKSLEAEKREALLAMADAETEARKYSVDTEGIREMLERDMAALESGSATELRRLVLLYVEKVLIFPPPPGKRSGHNIEVNLKIYRPQDMKGEGPPDNMRNEGTPLGVPELHTLGGELSPPSCFFTGRMIRSLASILCPERFPVGGGKIFIWSPYICNTRRI